MPNKRLFITFLAIALFSSFHSFSQSVGISSNAATPDTTAILDVNSTTKGMLVPRMTAQQKNDIASPATGLLVFQTDGNTGFYYYNGTAWLLLISSAVNTDKQNTLIYTTQGF